MFGTAYINLVMNTSYNNLVLSRIDSLSGHRHRNTLLVGLSGRDVLEITGQLSPPRMWRRKYAS